MHSEKVLFMRIFLSVLILIFSLHFSSKADDIRDFAIEGISIGDSLLLYSSEKEIKENMITDYNSKKYSRYSFREINSNSLDQYDDIQVHFQTNDKNYIIVSISGGIYNENKFDECLKLKEEVIKEISEIFPNSDKQDGGTSSWYEADPTGKTITSQYFFYLGPEEYTDYIEAACYDWGAEAAEKYNAGDHFKLALIEKTFGKWLSIDAWK